MHGGFGRRYFGKRFCLDNTQSDCLDEGVTQLCKINQPEIQNKDECPQLLLFKGTCNENNEINVLIDGGANGDFISSSLVSEIKLKAFTRSPFKIIYGNGDEEICRYTVRIRIQINEYNDFVQLNVANLQGCDVLFGKPWLRKYNPKINWKTDDIVFQKDGKEICLSNNQHDTTTDGVISAIQIKRVLRDRETDCHLFLIRDVKSDSDIQDKQHCKELSKVLSSYEDVFNNPNELPKSTVHDHKIKTFPDSSPPNRPPYRLSEDDLKEVQFQITNLLEKNYIKPSSSPYGAPVILVKKKDGTKRMCIDYRALNKMTIKNKFPLPLAEDLFDALKDATIYSKIDLESGFNQVLINKEDRHKTAFRTRFGHYEYSVMPFGLTNAPATFMCMMNSVFSKYLFKSVVVFVDGILIYSKNMEEHVKHVEEVLETLRANHLYAKLKKCQFGVNSVDYIGHHISSEGISPIEDKVKAIKTWPTPDNVKAVRAFLGLASYYLKYIRNFAQIAAPMTDLLKAKTKKKFEWGQLQTNSFEELKNRLSTTPVLKIPDNKGKFKLTTDASNISIGAVLEQQDSEGHFRPIAFDSRKLTPSEVNYPVHERELLAIIHTLRKWRIYLTGQEFDIFTDHSPLRYLQTQKTLSPRQTRWMMDLSDFDFTIHYKPGKQNIVADSLSRINIGTISTISGCAAFSDRIKQAYITDPNISSIIRALEEGGQHGEYKKTNGLILIRGKIYVPHNIDKSEIINEAHNTPIGGHLGIIKTRKSISQCFFWPNMTNDIETFVQACNTCQRMKSTNQKPTGLLKPIPIPSQPWLQIGMDFITHLPKTQRSYDSLLVVTDYYSKRMRLIPTRQTNTAKEITRQFFDNIFKHHGIPKVIISDRDTKFLSQFWKNLFQLLGTTLAPSTAYHPQTDGLTERCNRTIEEMIRCFIHHCAENEWDLLLTPLEFVYNSSVHTSTNYAPFQLDLGRTPIRITH